MRGQRGFTLIEMVVVAAILALLATVAVISLAQRPGALESAVNGFDASLAAARAIAASSGNGATLVFAARTPASLPGYTLTVYRGRPNRERCGSGDDGDADRQRCGRDRSVVGSADVFDILVERGARQRTARVSDVRP
ncbi:MAG TPA: type II secretion system protein [Candidatus Baltobacteraceae bacterium]